MPQTGTRAAPRGRPCPPPPAASANATKKSFELELVKPGGKNGSDAGGSSSSTDGGGASDGLKKNDFPFLGMPADQDWIL